MMRTSEPRRGFDAKTTTMAFGSWRGTVGIIRPTLRTGGFDGLVRMPPEGIGVIPLCLDVRRGALDELRKGVHAFEPKIAQLAETGVDVINPSGAPPFMVLGYRCEQRLIKAREKRYKTAIFTSGTTTLDALRALSVRRFMG